MTETAILDTVILDTDVASFFFKNSPKTKPFRRMVKGKRLALAFVSPLRSRSNGRRSARGA